MLVFPLQMVKNISFLFFYHICFCTNWHSRQATWIVSKHEHDTHVLQLLKDIRDELHMDGHNAIPVGLHGGGTPYGWSKRDSLEVFSLNFLCARQDNIAKLRIPMFICNKKHMQKGSTKNRVLQVLAWSFTCLATGMVFEFEGGGGTKACPLVCPLPVAYLVQLRADWAFFERYMDCHNTMNWLVCVICVKLILATGEMWVWMPSGGTSGWVLKCFTVTKRQEACHLVLF